MKKRSLSVLSLIANLAIVVFVVLSIVSFYTPLFGEVNPETLKTIYFYFTVESCLFLGLVALIEIPFLINSISKRRYLVPGFLQALKLVAVTMTTLTMITALSWLSVAFGFALMVEGVNLFLHILIPALGLLTFIIFEAQSRYKIKHAFYVAIPMAGYIFFYFAAIFLFDIGIKDWYVLAYDYAEGVRSENVNILKSILSIVIFLIAPVVLSLVICLLNKLFYKAFFVRKPLPNPEDTKTPEGKKVVIIKDVKKDEEATEPELVEDEAPEEVKEEPVEEPEEEEAEEEPVEEKNEEKAKKPASSKKSADSKPKAKKEPAKKAPAKKAAQPVASSEFGKYEGKTRVYHISQSKSVDGQWQVKLAGGDKAIKIFKTQKEAIDFAKGLIRTQGGSIRIHSMKGKMRK